jgi:hypothetical protein
MGRPRKVIPTFDAAVVIKSRTAGRLTISNFGNFNESWLTLPGSPDDFTKAFLGWLREYQSGPKRVRKPVVKPRAVKVQIEN